MIPTPKYPDENYNENGWKFWGNNYFKKSSTMHGVKYFLTSNN